MPVVVVHVPFGVELVVRVVRQRELGEVQVIWRATTGTNFGSRRGLRVLPEYDRGPRTASSFTVTGLALFKPMYLHFAYFPAPAHSLR